MGGALSLCIVDDSWEPEEVFVQKILKRYLDNGEAKLSLSIASLPDQGCTSSSRRSLFASANRIAEVWVETLQVAKGWAPLRWRYSQPTTSGGGAVDERSSQGQGPPQRFWRAKVITVFASGEERSQWCLLQVATEPAQRSMENAMLDKKDADKVAGFAHAFNQLLARDESSMGGDGCPGVCVCLPVVCKVLQSPVPQFFARGDSVQLLPYSASEVTKFVFDGHEDFLEIPHAFFHYVTWFSHGHECVNDLQGVEEDNGSVTIVNPFLPRPFTMGSGNFFGGQKQGISDRASAPWPAAPSPQMFDKLHPRCGPLCKSFDPDRRAKPVRKHCGLPISCGLNQPNCDTRTRGSQAPTFTIL